MLGRRVWSDDEVQKLAANFLCVADEVWGLEHLDTPGHKFFQAFGKKLPATHEQVVTASRLVPDEVVQRCTASGEPDEVVAKVGEYVANGCTCPILYPLGPDVELMLDTFART